MMVYSRYTTHSVLRSETLHCAVFFVFIYLFYLLCISIVTKETMSKHIECVTKWPIYLRLVCFTAVYPCLGIYWYLLYSYFLSWVNLPKTIYLSWLYFHYVVKFPINEKAYFLLAILFSNWFGSGYVLHLQMPVKSHLDQIYRRTWFTLMSWALLLNITWVKDEAVFKSESSTEIIWKIVIERVHQSKYFQKRAKAADSVATQPRWLSLWTLWVTVGVWEWAAMVSWPWFPLLIGSA